LCLKLLRKGVFELDVEERAKIFDKFDDFFNKTNNVVLRLFQLLLTVGTKVEGRTSGCSEGST
jgi:hypothetical protein